MSTSSAIRPRFPAGQALGGALDLRTPPLGTFLDLPGSDVTLPEAGRYELSADLQTSTQWTAAGRQIAGVIARFFNVTTGAAVSDSQRSIGWEDTPSGIANRVVYANGTLHALVTVTGPTTYRVQGARGYGAGNVPSNGNTTNHIMATAASRNLILWRKISD